MTIYSLGGKEITFRDQGAGEMFGELGAIDGEPRSAHVMALEDSLLASIAHGQERILLLEARRPSHDPLRIQELCSNCQSGPDTPRPRNSRWLPGNMPELTPAYTSYIESIIPDMQLNAKHLFGCRGIVLPSRSTSYRNATSFST